MQMMTNMLLKYFEQQLINKQVAYALLKEVERYKDAVTVEPLQETLTVAFDEDTRAALSQWAADGGDIRTAVAACFAFIAALVDNKPAYSLLLQGPDGPRHLDINAPGTTTFQDLVAQLSREGVAVGTDVTGAEYAFAVSHTPPAETEALPVSRICLSLKVEARRPTAVLHVKPGAFEDGWIAGLALQMNHFLGAFLAAPETPIDQLDLLPLAHKELLQAYNRTAQYIPREKTIHQLFYEQAARTPHRTAVFSRGVARSYDELNRISNRIAHMLIKFGVRPDDLVGVISHRNVELPTALLAVLKSGGAYVPMEPTYPAERVDHIMNNTRARVLITTSDVLRECRFDLDALPHLKHIICLDAWDKSIKLKARVHDRARIDAASDRNPPLLGRPENLSYIIFTSGSTGKPKGVVIRHYSVVNTIVGINNLFGVTEEDKVFGFSSVCFDLSVYDLFGAWAVGAELVFADEAQIKNPHALMDLIEARQVTLWDSVPTGMKQLVMGLEGSSRTNDSLRLVMLSGEFIPLTLPEGIRKHFPKTQITSLGGATEGTVWSIYHYPVNEIDPRWASIPYGRPLANQTYYVLNDRMRPCALGQVGMLYIGGLGVAAGYFNDREKTEAAFVANPFSDDPADKIYKTGDLGRMRFDGEIEIIGRADSQVKIRGFRVEMGEVEAQLECCPRVDACAILLKRDDAGNNRLAAYYVPAEPGVTPEQLRDFLAAKLPSYMVPGQFIRVKSMPVNASGKLDRKALGRIEEDTSVETLEAFVAPSTEDEKRIADILTDLLKLERVSIHDDFFLIGGDSLLSLQYAGKLKAAGYEVGPAEIFHNATIAKLLAHLADQGEDAGAQRGHEPGPVALGPQQKRFFQTLHLARPDHWNQSIELAVPKDLDLDRLTLALDQVVAHHPTLRTRFIQDPDGGLVQEVVADMGARIDRYTLKGLTLLGRMQHLKRIKQEIHQGIDIRKGPLMRLAHVTQTGKTDRLIWVAHHLLTDAYCWRVLLEDLSAAYQGLGEGRRVQLAGSDAYRTYVAELDRAARALPADEQAHWADYLSRPRFSVPVDNPGAANLEGESTTLTWALSPQDTRKLQGSLRRKGITLHDGVLAAFARSLGQWAGSDRPALDIVSNGRDVRGASLDMSRTIGWCAPVHPFMTRVVGGQTADNVAAVQEDRALHQQFQNHFLPLRYGADHALSEQFAGYREQDVLFNYLGDFDSVEVDGAWQILGNAGFDRAPENARTHKLEFEAFVAGGRMMTAFYYSRDLHRAGSIRTLRNIFKANLVSLM